MLPHRPPWRPLPQLQCLKLCGQRRLPLHGSSRQIPPQRHKQYPQCRRAAPRRQPQPQRLRLVLPVDSGRTATRSRRSQLVEVPLVPPCLRQLAPPRRPLVRRDLRTSRGCCRHQRVWSHLPLTTCCQRWTSTREPGMLRSVETPSGEHALLKAAAVHSARVQHPMQVWLMGSSSRAPQTRARRGAALQRAAGWRRVAPDPGSLAHPRALTHGRPPLTRHTLSPPRRPRRPCWRSSST